jgi:uncharacterized membrane protein YfcA
VEFAILAVAALLFGIVSGFAGFAGSAVGGAVLLHYFEPQLAVPLMMLCSIVSQVTSLTALRRFIAWGEVTPLLVGGAAGVPIALYLLLQADAQIFRIGFGLFIAGYAGYMLLRRASTAAFRFVGPARKIALGFAGGLVGGLTAMPSAVPAIWCDLRGMPKERQRTIVQPFTLVMQLWAIAVLFGSQSVVDERLLPYAIFSLPTVLAGTLLGVLLFGKIDQAMFRTAVLSLLLVSGCLMLR